jgi:hypothetical protein|tara:strand:- start:630 stop:1082 length:453 start_codon:yes stop_codon:yes gene_type:complete
MGHTDLPFERTVGSRPLNYGCRNCDGSTYSYVTGIWHESLEEKKQAEQAIVLAKQDKINLAASIAQFEKLSNEIIQKNIEQEQEEKLLQIQLENQRIQNEIDRKETSRLLELKKQKIIIPEIIPAVVATSSLIPLGIIAILLINSSRGKK